ncbi:MAG: complex I subunit 5 family protein [Kiritimatiellia bacterium]
MDSSFLLLLLVLLPVTIAAMGYFLPQRAYHRLLVSANLATTATAMLVFIMVRTEGTLAHAVAGWPQAIAIRLVADALSAPLVLLATLFFTGTFLFSTRAAYLDKTFMFLFCTLESAMLGIFLSGDLFNIYVFIELSMLIIAILIMYKQDKQSVYDAMLYLMMNFIAMAFMLLGLGMIYRITGVLDLDLMHARIALLESPKSVMLPFAMIMTAIALKAAMFPLFSWLPRAHGAPSAPAIVSAVLSGVQVKTGVYLLIRVSAVFAPQLDASAFFLVLGFITAVVGFLLAICQKDIKLILAYHTVSQMGLIVMGLHLGTETAFYGGLYHIMNHALFKGLLFLTAGTIIESYHRRSYAEIRGVMRTMPAIGIGTLCGMLGITGAPFFNGSISKYFISDGLQGDWGGMAMFLINLGTTLSFVKYSVVLFGKPAGKVDLPRDPWVASISMIFGLACLLGGLFGGPAVQWLFGPTLKTAGAFSLQKLTGFGITLGVAVLAYHLIVTRIGTVLTTVRTNKFTFNQLTVMLTLFFLALLAFLWMQDF